MIKTKFFTLFAICALLALSSKEGAAQDKAFQLSLVNPIELVGESSSITGLRINLLYGKNTAVTGLDWGMVNHTTSGTSTGSEMGFVNFCEANFSGGQSGAVNVTEGKLEGVQWGAVNYAGEVSGIQIGLVNYASNMKRGLQLGLVNVIKQNGKFPVFPIINWAL